MLGLVPVRRAILSVSDKTDLVPFARALADLGIEIVSTGGSATTIAAAGVPVETVERLTGHPEILDGRVKTLHPKVHGGVLGRRDRDAHTAAMAEHGIPPIDLVCVNLYPFERTIREQGIGEEAAIEQIDIGGPALLRSAAKNFQFVCVVTSPRQYDRVVAELRRHDGATSQALRAEFATAAFARTAEYDTAIASWMGHRHGGGFPEVLQLTFTGRSDLRYGENPHQRAATYLDPHAAGPSVLGGRVLGGKAISYNNLLDAASGLELVLDLRDLEPQTPVAAVLKHNNACGVAQGRDLPDAFRRAWEGDPLAAFGGVVVIGGAVEIDTAEAIVEARRFVEVIVADRFSDEAEALLQERRPNARLLAVGPPVPHGVPPLEVRSVPGGLLVQERDRYPVNAADFRHVAGPPPAPETLRDAAFLFTAVKHLKSNAVAIGVRGRLLGMGCGCVDRVGACAAAVAKAGDRLTTPGEGVVVAASDAFFPFPDGPARLLDAGVRCLIHPGGSKRDEETFALCAERGATCLLTGVRHFRH
jgi:phosphoribosylaminoimidazolecarboxamide formyltransferase/IMP cyclohydrolase